MKKQVELTKIDLKSLFRAVVISSVILVIIQVILGFIAGGGMGLFYLLGPVGSGLVAMLLGASYNWLAPQYGGVKVEVTIHD